MKQLVLLCVLVVGCGSGSDDPIEIPEGCGDGTVAGDEQCDAGGESVECNVDCTLTACGDGVRNVSAAEACDDGNNDNGDGCSDDCHLELPPFCGDGNVNSGEGCDDGNTDDGDGCSADCQLEESQLCGVSELTCTATGVQGNTADATATSMFASYTCLPDEPKGGPEVMFDWIADRNGPVSVFLEGSGTLDVIVLEATPTCGAGTCVAAGRAGASFTAELGKHYLLVVDSDPGTTSPFFIGMSCQ